MEILANGRSIHALQFDEFPRWTNVEDALPEKDGKYLVTMIEGYDVHHVATRYFRGAGYPIQGWMKTQKECCWNKRTKGVIAWAPLPRPY